MSFFIIDVETDGPIPYKYSLISIGAIKVIEDIDNAPTFYRQLKPISEHWDKDALAVTGFTREETITFERPKKVIEDFKAWILDNNKNGRPVFISDNNSFDFAWINWYFHYFLGENPFGWSSRRIGDFYAGITNDWYAKWKHLRKTPHTHNALDDAKANATALLTIFEEHKVKIDLK